MQPFYLDAPFEVASKDILSKHTVVISTEQPVGDAVELPESLGHEHTSSAPVSYFITEGQIILDFRDTADCWIRATLSAGQSVSLGPEVSRRINSAIKSKLIQIDAASEKKFRYGRVSDSIVSIEYHKYRELVCDLCVQFFEAGWVTGTGGSISIRHGDRIYMTPSGVQKERIQPDELYVLDVAGNILSVPTRKPGCKEPKLSDCSPLFLHAFQQRNAGAVLHSHSMCCNLITSIFEGQTEFRISHQEMIKGIAGYGYFDTLTIPIIENTAWEHELADSLGDAIRANPGACAVLVRRHGMYVWGDTWEQAKRHGECLHYLFEIAISMRKLGMDFNSPPRPVGSVSTVEVGRKRGVDAVAVEASLTTKRLNGTTPAYKYVVFDIEGTTTPITFVKDFLFPYAAEHVGSFLSATWDSTETQGDIASLWAQAAADEIEGLLAALPPKTGLETSSKESQISWLTQYVRASIAADRKIGALKQLQGHIWRNGYESGAIKSVVYDDVVTSFQTITALGARVGIYSSGSRQAQRLLFQYSDQGDLREYLSVYFDTAVGHKQKPASYAEILLSLGLDNAAQVLFVTDVLEEAQAAREAGLHAVLSVRPGNKPLPAGHGFLEVTSFDALPL